MFNWLRGLTTTKNFNARQVTTKVTPAARLYLSQVLSSRYKEESEKQIELDTKFFGALGQKNRFSEIEQAAKEEIKEGLWSKREIRDERGNLVYKQLEDLAQEGSGSDILSLRRNALSTRRVLTLNPQDLQDVVKKKYFDRELDKEYFDYRADDQRKFLGETLALTGLGIELDLDRGLISPGNLAEARNFYQKANPEEGEDGFNKFVKHFIGVGLEHSLGSAKTWQWDKQTKDLDVFDEAFWKISSDFVKEIKSNAKIYRSTKPLNEEDLKADSDQIHLINSPFRHEDHLRSGLMRISKYKNRVATSFFVNAVLEDAAKEVYGAEYQKFFKQMEFSPNMGATGFPRDYSVFCNEAFHQTEQKLAEAISSEMHINSVAKAMFGKGSATVFDNLTHEDRINSHKGDLEFSGYKVVQDIPFDAAGGNMISTRNAEGKKVLLATVSDKYFEDDGKFIGGYMLDEDGKVRAFKNSEISNLLTGEKYPKFRKKIKDWGESVGYDEVIVIDRNIEKSGDNIFRNLYHLDIFCGALPKGHLVINEKAVSKENMADLKRVFGEDKIIPLNQEEQSKLCANFVVFDRLVLMSDPETPQTFIDKLTERGFDVYVSPLPLTIPETQKKGWLAGIRCLTTTANVERELLDTKYSPSAKISFVESFQKLCSNLLGRDEKSSSNQI